MSIIKHCLLIALIASPALAEDQATIDAVEKFVEGRVKEVEQTQRYHPTTDSAVTELNRILEKIKRLRNPEAYKKCQEEKGRCGQLESECGVLWSPSF